jgi:hypothetical protein
MDLDPTLRVALLVLLIGGFGLVLYVELRYMRKRNKSKIDVRMTRDETYNGIITTRAVARVLREKGTDTSEAELLLLKAEGAYGRRDYLICKEAVEEAKMSLERGKSREMEPTEPEESKPQIIPGAEEKGPDAEEKGRESTPLFEEAKKLPDNYLQSKFMISSVKSGLESLSSERETSEARSWLARAESSFKAGEYTHAFSHACKARKSLDTSPLKDKAAIAVEVIETELPETEEAEESIHEPAEAPLRCAECGAELLEGDMFCGQCGAPVRKRIACPSCGAEAREGDRFCRHCGSSLS